MQLLAGVCRETVTPDPLLPVTGGTGAWRAATHKHGELEVRVLGLAQGDCRVAIVSMPFIAWPGALCRRVRAGVRAFPADNVIITATHTHSAPDPYGFPNPQGEYGIAPEYLAEVCERTAALIDECAARLKPATLRIAEGEAFGKIAYNRYASAFFDPRCGVIQVMRDNGAPLATLVNYACHPEVLVHQPVCSPDFAGPLQEFIEESGGGMGIFVNGALGGLITADNRDAAGAHEDWEECIRIGRLLGGEALRIAANAAWQPAPRLWCGARPIAIPVNEPIAQLMQLLHPATRAEAGLGQIPGEMIAQVNVLNLGNAQILTVPGEALPNVGCYLKRNLHGAHNFIFGIANDGLGYFMSKVDFHSLKIYEYISATALHEMAGEVLMAESLKFAAECPRPLERASQQAG